MLQILPSIPNKEYFTISEVSQITMIQKYTLRYWESEFKLLRPLRKSSGQRRYNREEIYLVFKIKDLLYNKRYTIEGAKKYLIRDKRKKTVSLDHLSSSKLLDDIKEDLGNVLKLLKKM
ncbi:MAG: MerR family transcriptional regulator [Endomicrobium sp.]|nr:MerR family transcriptional regulator [Endomicrobium sp.]